MKEQKEKPLIDTEVLLEAEKFFLENNRAIADYARKTGISFEPGEKWSIDMRTGRAIFDVGFFVHRGYMTPEIMWAVCHEIEHFRDWRRDPEGYAALYARLGRGRRRLEILYHGLNDIAVNKEEDRRFPAHIETRIRLYTYRFIPRVDHTQRPLHLQFAEGIVRERMLPGEGVVLASEVRTEVERLKNIDDAGTDLIELVTDVRAKPGDRFELVRDYIEPIYERFFHRDVEERRKMGRERSTPGGDRAEISIDGSKSGAEVELQAEPENEEDFFGDEYDEARDRFLQTLSVEEVRDAIDEEIKHRDDETKTPEQMAREQFRILHGVSADEVEDYAQQYGKVEEYIRPLRAVFERVIEMRKRIRRRLKERTDEGVMVDPSLVAQAYIDVQNGIFNSRTDLRVRQEELDEHRPLDFEFTLICDLSGSMNEELPGGKSYEQRLCAILITEALDEFEKKLQVERADKLLDLQVFTEVRGFGAEDEELKEMSGVINYHTRVKIAKRLATCLGSSTAEYTSLSKIAARVGSRSGFSEERDLKRAVVLMTDGGSDDTVRTRRMKDDLKTRNVVVKAIQIGDPSTEDWDKFRRVWEDDGLPCRDVTRLVPTMEKLMEELIEDL